MIQQAKEVMFKTHTNSVNSYLRKAKGTDSKFLTSYFQDCAAKSMVDAYLEWKSEKELEQLERIRCENA